jgi:hypothetical protein
MLIPFRLREDSYWARLETTPTQAGKKSFPFAPFAVGAVGTILGFGCDAEAAGSVVNFAKCNLSVENLQGRFSRAGR